MSKKVLTYHAGDMEVTITGQVAETVTVALGDSADDVAGKIVTAIAAKATAAGFTATASTDGSGKVILTANANAADVVVAITIDDSSNNTGATVAIASATTVNGLADSGANQQQKDQLTVTVPSTGAVAGKIKVTVTIDGTDYTVNVVIADNETANDIATKIATISIAGWTTTVNGDNVEFEANTAATDVNFTVTFTHL